MEKRRTLGRSGIAVGAIGGDNFGKVDDEESIRAIRVALEMGANLFDTANVYGGGHSERVLGQALKGRRSEAAIATKFGYVYDEEAGAITGECAAREHILSACEASLERLGTDYIDLYLLHIGALTGDAALEAIGKYGKDARLPGEDVRGRNIEWVPYFKDGALTDRFAQKIEAAREILTSGGRTLAQGALCWLLAKSPNAIPIPGFKSAAQVRENLGALDFGPLTGAQLSELEKLIPPLRWSQM